MVEVLSEVNWGKAIEPVTKVLTKKKKNLNSLKNKLEITILVT
jgi:hypothetical protein